MRPTFLVLGAAKAGTTTLCELLARHPDVFLTQRKELHYFSFDDVHARGPAWYEAHFAAASEAHARGEASTSYSVRKLFPHAPARIAAYDPRLRLVYLARDPLPRIESAWLHLRHFATDDPFERVGVRGTPEALRVDVDFNRAVRRQADALVESTNYWRELQPYRALFPDEQLLVLLFEDLVARPRVVLQRCFRFLGVDPDVPLPTEAAHGNSAAQRWQPRDALWRLWASPRRRRAYRAAVGVLPQRVRDGFAGVLGTRSAARPHWEPGTRAWVLEQLADDSARFLEHFGYARDAWTSLRAGA